MIKEYEYSNNLKVNIPWWYKVSDHVVILNTRDGLFIDRQIDVDLVKLNLYIY